MVLVGSSEVSGSWKIIAMSLPRSLRSSASGRAASSRPSSLIDPPTILPPGGSSLMIDRPVIDLPQPDSPTSPSVSPGSMCRSTLPTACTTDLLSWIWVDRSVISRTGAIRGAPQLGQWACRAGHDRSAAAQPHVQRVAQGIADEVAGHHHQHDAGTDREHQPPGAVLQVFNALGQHVSPVLCRVVQ